MGKLTYARVTDCGRCGFSFVRPNARTEPDDDRSWRLSSFELHDEFTRIRNRSPGLGALHPWGANG